MKDFKTVKAKNEATYLKAKEQNIRLFWKTYAEFVRINTFKRLYQNANFGWRFPHFNTKF
jgi:hypothetical protein